MLFFFSLLLSTPCVNFILYLYLLSSYLQIHVYVYQLIFQYIHLYLSTYPLIYLSIISTNTYISIYLSIWLSIHPYIFLSIHTYDTGILIPASWLSVLIFTCNHSATALCQLFEVIQFHNCAFMYVVLKLKWFHRITSDHLFTDPFTYSTKGACMPLVLKFVWWIYVYNIWIMKKLWLGNASYYW